MAHLHNVYDADTHFIIDAAARTIKSVSQVQKIIIQGDHNSERLTFEVPRFVEGHDMSLCTKVEVHFNNISVDKKKESRDVYKVNDIEVSSGLDDVVIFSWLISGNATRYAGILSFLIKFTCLTGETIDYAWHTDIYSDIKVGEGMDNGEAVVAEYSDVLEAWKAELTIERDEVLREIEAAKKAMLEEIEIAGSIVQTTGGSDTAVMSQSAVTRALEDFMGFMPINQTDPRWEVVEGQYANSAGWVAGSTFKSFKYIAEKDFSIYWGKIPASYTSVALYLNGEVTAANFKTLKRNTDNNLPTEDSKLYVAAGDVVVISVWTSNGTFECFTNMADVYLAERFKFTQGTMESIKNYVDGSSSYVRYIAGSGVDSSTERLEVYLRTPAGFIRYDLVHSVKADFNADVWRVGRAYKCASDLSSPTAITTTGEWECSVKLDGRSDFSGGVAHGDEVTNGIKLFLDTNASETNITGLTGLTSFKELRIIQTSNLYDPTDSETLIATRGCEYVFDSRGLRIRQSLQWAVDATITQCYMAMFPVLKSMTSHIYTDSDFSIEELTTYPVIKKKAKKARIFSEASGVMCEFNITDYPDSYSGGDLLMVHDNGGGAYNKCYYCISYAQSNGVTSGTFWRAETYYNIQAN